MGLLKGGLGGADCDGKRGPWDDLLLYDCGLCESSSKPLLESLGLMVVDIWEAELETE